MGDICTIIHIGAAAHKTPDAPSVASKHFPESIDSNVALSELIQHLESSIGFLLFWCHDNSDLRHINAAHMSCPGLSSSMIGPQQDRLPTDRGGNAAIEGRKVQLSSILVFMGQYSMQSMRSMFMTGASRGAHGTRVPSCVIWAMSDSSLLYIQAGKYRDTRDVCC